MARRRGFGKRRVSPPGAPGAGARAKARAPRQAPSRAPRHAARAAPVERSPSSRARPPSTTMAQSAAKTRRRGRRSRGAPPGEPTEAEQQAGEVAQVAGGGRPRCLPQGVRPEQRPGAADEDGGPGRRGGMAGGHGRATGQGLPADAARSVRRGHCRFHAAQQDPASSNARPSTPSPSRSARIYPHAGKTLPDGRRSCLQGGAGCRGIAQLGRQCGCFPRSPGSARRRRRSSGSAPNAEDLGVGCGNSCARPDILRRCKTSAARERSKGIDRGAAQDVVPQPRAQAPRSRRRRPGQERMSPPVPGCRHRRDVRPARPLRTPPMSISLSGPASPRATEHEDAGMPDAHRRQHRLVVPQGGDQWRQRLPHAARIGQPPPERERTKKWPARRPAIRRSGNPQVQSAGAL